MPKCVSNNPNATSMEVLLLGKLKTCTSSTKDTLFTHLESIYFSLPLYEVTAIFSY